MTAPACAGIASRSDVSPSVPSPIRQVKSIAGLAAFTAAAWSGKSPWHRNAFAPEAVARYATSSGISRKLVGTQTAPRRNAANIDQNISSQFLECTRMRSPLTTPRAASAAANAETFASISRQVQQRSPQMKPRRSPCRRAFWVRKCARFMTRRDIRITLPDNAAGVTGSVTWCSPPPHPHACREQHHADDAGDDAVLDMRVGDAGLVTGEKARQLIRRHHEIDGGDDQQNDSEQGQNEL